MQDGISFDFGARPIVGGESGRDVAPEPVDGASGRAFLTGL